MNLLICTILSRNDVTMIGVRLALGLRLGIGLGLRLGLELRLVLDLVRQA